MTTGRFIETVAASGLVDEASRPAFEAIVSSWVGSDAPVDRRLLDALADASIVTPWQASQLLKGRYKGFFLGKYRLLRLLGTGGMSSVYLAEHATLRHLVAIKVLPVKRAEGTSFLERFQREARASARLNHPNLARVSDIDSFGDVHFMVMEYVDGVDLHARVKNEGPLPVREAVDLARQAALGLDYAHQEGFVHRDVKPANMILDRRGTLKILDLGLALPSAEEDRLASLTHEHDEQVLGTADYLAPEQAHDSHTADKRSDIYSLGCTLFFLLVGKGPFSGGPVADRIRRHIHDPAPNLLDLRPEVPPAIVEVVYRMMEKHPDARYQSAGEVAELLSAWLNEAPRAATPATAARPRPSREALRRHPARSRSTASPNAPPHRPSRPLQGGDDGTASGAGSSTAERSSSSAVGPEGPSQSGPAGSVSGIPPSGASGPSAAGSLPPSTPPPSDVHQFGTFGGDAFPEPSLSSVLAATPSPHRADRSTIGRPSGSLVGGPPDRSPAARTSLAPRSGGGGTRRGRRRANRLGVPFEAWVMLGLGLVAAAGLATILLLR
jgi:serine/threonine protein kinase